MQGHRKISPIPPAAELVQMLLKYLLDPNDEDRAYVPFHPEDEVLLLINNMGGTSTLEMGAFTQEVLSGLGTLCHIHRFQLTALTNLHRVLLFDQT